MFEQSTRDLHLQSFLVSLAVVVDAAAAVVVAVKEVLVVLRPFDLPKTCFFCDTDTLRHDGEHWFSVAGFVFVVCLVTVIDGILDCT